MRLHPSLSVPHPVVCAPMAGAGGGRLAHAVSRAGGLGMFGVMHDKEPGWIRQQAELAGAGGTAYGVGLMAWALERNPAQLDAVLELRPALVSVSFGAYAAPVRRLREAGLVTATQIGSLADLEAAEDAGVDVVVARGGEGGGHGRDEIATLPLLQMVLDRTERPVLAAGGILNHRGVAAVLAAGAVGAWAGTVFLGCVEADNTPEARAALLAAGATGYGRVFDVAQQAAWPPEFGGRAVANDFFRRWRGREDEIDEAARAAFRDAVQRRDPAALPLYAGQGVAALTAETTAADVVAGLGRAVGRRGGSA